MTKFWNMSLFAAAIAMTFAAAPMASAHVIYFSETGPGAIVPSDPDDETSKRIVEGGLSENTIPVVDLTVGDTKTLYIWINPDNRVGTLNNTNPSLRRITSVALDIALAGSGGLGSGSLELANPENLSSGSTRWDNVVRDPPSGTGGFLVEGDYAFAVQRAGLGNHDARYDFDSARDDVTGSFYLGSVTFNATFAGDVGLYFRNGRFKTVATYDNTIAGSNPPQNPPDDTTNDTFQYGDATLTHNGTEVGAGDPIGPNLELADAIIHIEGGVLLRDVFRFNADAGTVVTGTFPGPNGGTPTNLAVGASSGVILVEDVEESFFDVFLDITPTAGNTIQSILDTLIAQAGAATPPTNGYTASLADGPDDLGLGIDYDIRVVLPITFGSDVRFDFDFGTTATVDNVGVPEPSTLVLAALGSVALIGLRRRRK